MTRNQWIALGAGISLMVLIHRWLPGWSSEMVFAVAGVAFIFMAGFEKRRHRAKWARWLLMATGTICLTVGLGTVLTKLGIITVPYRAAWAVQCVKSDLENVALGWLIALLASGELFGKGSSVGEAPSRPLATNV